MGVDTKGIVVVQERDQKDPFVVADLVCKALKASDLTMKVDRGPYFNLGVCSVYVELKPFSKMVNFFFEESSGIKRCLKVFFGCDSDHKDKGNHSITFMLGCHGESVGLMREVLTAVQQGIENSSAFIWEADSTGGYRPIAEEAEGFRMEVCGG